MNETIASIVKWHEETFPNATLDGQLEKFDEEYEELEKETPNTTDWFCELADLFIVACGVSRFDTVRAMGEFSEVLKQLALLEVDYRYFTRFVDKKMELNRNRVWNDLGNGNYHHKED